ncbi:MAG TPA: gamma-glutamyltransferase, partial [Burkholderiaceae bacterium]|nr:gamma-glutamyltransferase [Burkholderiaceae bacterium]
MRLDRRSGIVAGCIATLLVACATGTDRPSQPEASSAFRVGLNAVTANKHMAAAANPLATEAGREILRAGGSAVDAA